LSLCTGWAKLNPRALTNLPEKYDITTNKPQKNLESPVSCCVVAVVWQKVVVQFPENVQSDSAVGSKHAMISLPEHGFVVIESQVFRQQLVAQSVHLQQTLQFLHISQLIYFAFAQVLSLRTTTPVRSPASNLLRAKSSDFCISALIRWVINLFRSMERPSS